MEDLKGVACESCGREFKEDDRVAYCPLCGAPVHRSCWEEKGGCPFESRHSEGFVYQPHKKTEPMPSSEGIYASRSPDEKTDEDVPEIIRDLLNLGHRDSYSSDELEKAFSERIYDGVSAQEMACFMNVYAAQGVYRLTLMKYMIVNKRKVSFNLFAGLLNPYNQFYKGMAPLGLLLTLFNFVASVPQLIVYYASLWRSEAIINFLENSSILTASNFLWFIQLAVIMLLSVFGDYLYLSFMLKRIRQIRAKFDDSQSDEYYAALAAAGRPRPGLVVLGFLVQLLLVLIAFFFLGKIG